MQNSKLMIDFLTVLQKYKYLKIDNDNNVVGKIIFRQDPTDILCNYDIKILIDGYPKEVPKVISMDGKIESDFHTNPDTSLCLEVPLKIRMIYDTNPTLMGFIENLVNPFLFTHAFYKLNGYFPHGEHRHGDDGTLDYYKAVFRESDVRILFSILERISKKGYRGHSPCPCGSLKKFRKCHGKSAFNSNTNLVLYQSIIQSDFEYIKKAQATRANIDKMLKDIDFSCIP